MKIDTRTLYTVSWGVAPQGLALSKLGKVSYPIRQSEVVPTPDEAVVGRADVVTVEALVDEPGALGGLWQVCLLAGISLSVLWWTHLDDGEAGARCICASKVEGGLPVGDVEALDAVLTGLFGGGSQAQGSEEGKARELHCCSDQDSRDIALSKDGSDSEGYQTGQCDRAVGWTARCRSRQGPLKTRDGIGFESRLETSVVSSLLARCDETRVIVLNTVLSFSGLH